MSMYRKKEDVSKHLPRAFYLFGLEADIEAIQLPYFFDLIRALTAHLLNNKNKLPAVDVRTDPFSFDIRACLRLKAISGMRNKRAHYLFKFIYVLSSSPLMKRALDVLCHSSPRSFLRPCATERGNRVESLVDLIGR